MTKAKLFSYTAIGVLTIFSLVLLMGMISAQITVPGWIVLLGLAAYASLLFIL